MLKLKDANEIKKMRDIIAANHKEQFTSDEELQAIETKLTSFLFPLLRTSASDSSSIEGVDLMAISKFGIPI